MHIPKTAIEKLPKNESGNTFVLFESWISENPEIVDDRKVFSAQSEFSEEESEEYCVKKIKKYYPAEMIPQLISGVDEDFKPVVSRVFLNTLLERQGYKLV